MLWNVYQHKTTLDKLTGGIMLDIIFKGTHSECQMLVDILKYKCHICPHKLEPRRNIRNVIDVSKVLVMLSQLSPDNRHRLAKQLIGFYPAPPVLIRQNALNVTYPRWGFKQFQTAPCLIKIEA